MRLILISALVTLGAAGCDDPAAIERTKLAAMRARRASAPELCRQAKRLREAGNLIEGSYGMNQYCPGGAP